jgi:magnesium chelatase family protein
LLAAAHAARERRSVVVPAQNLAEARLVDAATSIGVESLLRASALTGDHATPGGIEAFSAEPSARQRGSPDLADVRGQAVPKRALLIAAAGAHSILLVGPPGTGKSMLAQRLPGLLPALEGQEAIDVASIASVSSRGFDARDFGRRPFRAPHHSASASAIIGGGPRAQPGEVSLAHHGVLFLDELPEFNRAVLEALREPLETGTVAISRAAMQVEYPARFQLVAAMNPCPCGYLGDPRGACRCAPPEVTRYRARISGPLLDRIDLRVEVPSLPNAELLGEYRPDDAASSPWCAERVARARALQRARGGKLNAELDGGEIQAHCRLAPAGQRLLAQARERLNLSARGIHRVLRVARTIADLESSGTGKQTGPDVGPAHLAEALQLRRAID